MNLSQSYFFKLFFVLVASLTFAGSALAIHETKTAMSESMEDPVISEAFHRTQLNLLQTKGDNLLHKLFTTNPAFRPLYEYLLEQHDAILRGFERSSQAHRALMVRGLTPQYDLLDKLVVDTAISLGFNKEAIQHRKIYIGAGEVNAFTVSGSQKRIIVVFEKGILQAMSRSEIAAVLAHELGHIRAEHTVMGIMNSVMLDVVGRAFGGEAAAERAGRGSFQLAPGKCLGVCSHPKLGNHTHNVEQHVESSPETLLNVNQQLEEFQERMLNSNPEALARTIKTYLNTVARIGEIEHLPSSTTRYLNSLVATVPQIGNLSLEMGEFEKHSQIVEHAISRAKEKTADQISASTVRNEHLASASVKLMGMDFDKEYRPQIFEHMRNEAKKLLESTSDKSMYTIAGSTHPSLVLRVNEMLNYAAYPGVLFANPFARHLLIASSLVDMNAELRSMIADLESEKSKDAEVMKYLKTLKADKAALEKAYAKQEGTVLDLLFSGKVSLSNKNAPRIDNAIQYFSVTQEAKFIYANRLAEALEQVANNPELKGTAQILIKTRNSILESISAENIFVVKIMAGLAAAEKNTAAPEAKENLLRRIALLKKITEAQSTVELEAVRATMAGQNKASEVQKRTRIPVSVYEATAPAPGATGLTCAGLFAK